MMRFPLPILAVCLYGWGCTERSAETAPAHSKNENYSDLVDQFRLYYDRILLVPGYDIGPDLRASIRVLNESIPPGDPFVAQFYKTMGGLQISLSKILEIDPTLIRSKGGVIQVTHWLPEAIRFPVICRLLRLSLETPSSKSRPIFLSEAKKVQSMDVRNPMGIPMLNNHQDFERICQIIKIKDCSRKLIYCDQATYLYAIIIGRKTGPLTGVKSMNVEFSKYTAYAQRGQIPGPHTPLQAVFEAYAELMRVSMEGPTVTARQDKMLHLVEELHSANGRLLTPVKYEN